MTDRLHLSRRQFVRYASAGAASAFLGGCATPPTRSTPPPSDAKPSGRRRGYSPARTDLIDRDGFSRVAEIAIDAATADHTFVSLEDRVGGTARFDASRVIEDHDTRRQTLSVQVAFGQQSGNAATTDLSDEAVCDAVRRAEEIAKASPEDPEYLPPLSPQRYPVLPTLRMETTAAGRGRRLAEAQRAIELCQAERLEAAGRVSTVVHAVGLAADTGLFAYEQRGRAELSLTTGSEHSTGAARNANRSIDDLGVVARTRVAIETAKRAAEPRRIPAGRYTVILAPSAVADLLAPLLRAADARTYHAGTGPYAGKLDQRIIDQRLTLQNRPDHPALLGNGFDQQGLPSDSHTWIERGVLRRLDYDRFTAKERGIQPSYRPDAAHLSGEGAAGETVEDLIASVERGILVSDLCDIRPVNGMGLALSGMTCNGTFLVEDGQITTGLVGLRWREDPLQAFNRITAFTTPIEAAGDYGKMLLPAVTIRDFEVTSVAQA
jgi:predicted Zn-dependent protease